MKSIVRSKRWLNRVIEIPRDDGLVLLTYSGRGVGSEKIMIQDEVVVGRSNCWFVSKFELIYENTIFIVQVRVWPWLTIRSLTIDEDGARVYSEGSEPYKVTTLTEILQLFLCFIVILGFLTALILILL